VVSFDPLFRFLPFATEKQYGESPSQGLNPEPPEFKPGTLAVDVFSAFNVDGEDEGKLSL
jgi:hypothetical protein